MTPSRPALALAASSLAFCLVLLDTSLVNVALPDIGRDLGASVTGLQWTINAYALVLATLLMSAGALADRLGARRLVLCGAALYLLGSLFAATANGVGVLVAAQGTLGLGAALLLPSSLSLLTHAYPDPVRRGVAVGIWSTVAAGSFAASPFLAGLLIDAGGWRAVFAVNVPFAVTVAVLLLWHVPDTPKRIARSLDLAGQGSAMVALGALTFALIESRALGWDSSAVIGCLGAVVLASAAFVIVERRSAAPMLPLGLFAARGFTWSIVAGLLVTFALYGQLFLLTLYLQEARGLSATEMGLVYLSQPIVVAFVGIPTGRMLGRIGPRVPLIVGGVAGLCGALLLAATIGPSTPYELIVGSLMLFGLAAGTIVPAVTSAVVLVVPAAQVGVASSALNAARQTGGVLGIALLGGLLSARDYVTGLPVTMVLCAAAFAGVAAVGVKLAGVQTARRPQASPARARA
jgi:DHA2 family methylenomycin A resistance protein-like MFS transporter